MGLHLIPNNLKLDFVGMRKISYIVSLLIILLGLVSLAIKGGPSYGVDFAGGATARIKFAAPVADAAVKKALEDAKFPGLTVQQFGTDGTGYLIRIAAVEETATGVHGSLKKALEVSVQTPFEVQQLSMAGPKVGADLRSKAIEAMYFAILLTAIYISGRFERRWFTAALMAAGLAGGMYGLSLLGIGKEYLVVLVLLVTVALCWKLKLVFALGAIVSMLHDVLITIGVLSLLNIEFDLTIIAALLTVVGYSLNDTIIVYDRIRENLRLTSSLPLREILNRSINQTLSRTVLTSGTTLLVITALLIWGGSIIHDFALTLFLGVFVGTASSMFVASPILLAFEDAIINQSQATQPKKIRDDDGRVAAQV